MAMVVLLLSSSAGAKNVAGVDIPESVTLENGALVKLNGAGIRSKFFFKIYAAGLYLTALSSKPEQIYSMPGGKRIFMQFIYDGVSKEKLVDGWNNGFEKNLSKTQLNNLSEEIEQFNNVFTEAKKNDQIVLDFIPEVGTEVRINNTLKVSIKGSEFYSALLKIWLGKEPADSDLKEALLGQ